MSELKWLLKLSGGGLVGPLSTSEIMAKISKSELEGHEYVAPYPDGKWIQISKEPLFYDQLLKVIESASSEQRINSKQSNYSKAASITAQESVSVLKKQSEKTKVLIDQTKPVNEANDVDSELNPQGLNSKFKKNLSNNLNKGAPHQTNDAQTIELGSVKAIKKRAAKASVVKPLIFMSVTIIIGIGVILYEKPDQDYLHLVLPGKETKQISASDFQKKLTSSIGEIENHTPESYITAQTNLVNLIEAQPTNLEIRALLCVVYKELWPFTKQDQAEQNKINKFAQQTRTLNLTSAYGNICEVVRLFTLERLNESKAVVDQLMDNVDNFTLLPIVYTYKGEMLMLEKDYPNAQAFLEKASKLWENWIYPKLLLANLFAQTKSPSKALESYNLILQKNPNHKLARIGMGSLYYRAYGKNSDAYDLLEAALQKKGRLPKRLEADANLILAEISMEDGQNKRALMYAERSLKLDSQNEGAKAVLVKLGAASKIKINKTQTGELISLGDQYARQGDCFSAQAQYKAAFDIDPKNGVAAWKAGKCLWKLNQSQESLNWLNKAIKADPKMISAYVTQAEFLAQRYDFVAAGEVLARGQKESPGNFEIYRGYAFLEYKKNNLSGAVAYAERAVKTFEGDVEALILLSRANLGLSLSIVPQNSKDSEKKVNAAKEAVRYANRAIEIDPSSVEANINYGKVLSATNGIETGVRWMQELIQKYARENEYKIGLAEILFSVERVNPAKDLYEQVYQLDSKNKKALLGLAKSYKSLGLYDKALQTLLSAAVLDPGDAEALFDLGLLHLVMNKKEDAVRQFKRVEAINSNFPRTYLMMGRTYFLMGNFDLAVEAAKKEKSKNPNLAEPYLLTAEIFQAKKMYSECSSEYAQAIKLQPFGADIYVKSAQCYRLSGSLEIAEDMLALASSRESGYAEIYREQGSIFEARGDNRSAVKAYRTYLELSPNAIDKRDVNLKIANLGG